ncbi:MAG: BrnA antitoxin family protein [Deltaproteobacteria bacterium]|nr:BrnA antitoxin family protein [Deltaproteobacteria bacterium]
MKEPDLRKMRYNKELTQQIRKSFAGKRKTRITIYIDDDSLEELKRSAADTGAAYQSLLNRMLRNALFNAEANSTETRLRRIERELARLKKKIAA